MQFLAVLLLAIIGCAYSFAPRMSKASVTSRALVSYYFYKFYYLNKLLK